MKPTMLSYIKKQPEILNTTFDNYHVYCDPIRDVCSKNKIKKIYFIGSGTSYHVSTLAKKYFEKFAKIEVSTSLPTAFISEEINVNQVYKKEEILILAISQTGTSYSTIHALKKAKDEGYTTAVFTQDPKSEITKLADLVLPMQCIKEEVPPETLGYTSAVLSVYLMALSIALDHSLITRETFESKLFDIKTLLTHTASVIDKSIMWFNSNKYELLSLQKLDIAGYGFNYTTAIEATLKVAETMKRKANGYEMEEFIHGPEMGYDSNNYCILIASDEREYERCFEIATFLKTITSHVFIITNKEHADLNKKDLLLSFDVSDELSPILFVIPFQILAALACESLGIDTSKYPHKHEMLSHTKDTQFQ